MIYAFECSWGCHIGRFICDVCDAAVENEDDKTELTSEAGGVAIHWHLCPGCYRRRCRDEARCPPELTRGRVAVRQIVTRHSTCAL